MNKPDISIFLGGIRPFLWERLYSSCIKAVAPHTFELIICGPYTPPESLQNTANFKYIRDFGSPVRAAQIAAKMAEGVLVTLGADDSVYYEGELSKAIDTWQDSNDVIHLSYGEGGNLMSDEYWKMHTFSHFRLKNIPPHAPMMLNSIMQKELFYKIGGYDCVNFQTCNWGGQDLTLRLMNHGVNIKKYPNHIMMCDWEAGAEGKYRDHKALGKIDDLNNPEGDYAIFKEIWNNNDARDSIIDYNNWKEAPSIWEPRFSLTIK